MQRRDFCNLMAIAGASKAMSAFGQIAQDNLPALPHGFNRYIQDYQTFCASPPEKRIFYVIEDGRIVEERLDEVTWHTPAWNYNPGPVAIAGGLWDNVPLGSALGASAPKNLGKIARVELIGTEERVKWRQSPDGLHVDLQMQYRTKVDYATALKVTLA